MPGKTLRDRRYGILAWSFIFCFLVLAAVTPARPALAASHNNGYQGSGSNDGSGDNGGAGDNDGSGHKGSGDNDDSGGKGSGEGGGKDNSAGSFTVQDQDPGVSPTTEPDSGNYNFVKKGFIGNDHTAQESFPVYVFLTNGGQAQPVDVDEPVKVTVTLTQEGSRTPTDVQNVTIPAENTYAPVSITCPSAGVWTLSVEEDSEQSCKDKSWKEPDPWTFTVGESANQGLEVDPSQAFIPVGGQQQFQAYWLFSFLGTNFKIPVTDFVLWSGSDPTIATVDSGTGATTGVSPGKVTITAQLNWWFIQLSGSADLTVVAPTGLMITPSSTTVLVGKTVALQAQLTFPASVNPSYLPVDVTTTAAWVSNAPSLATVGTSGTGGAQPGVVSGVAPTPVGSPVTITATAYGVSGTATIQVILPQVPQLKIEPGSLRLNTGDSYQLKAVEIYSDGSSSDVTDQATWSSASPLQVGVDLTGTVTAFSQTSDTGVTATYDGLSDTASVSVVDPSLTLSPPGDITVNSGTAKSYQVFYSDAVDTDLDVTGTAVWSTNDASVASVSAAGGTATITAGQAGTATITVTYDNSADYHDGGSHSVSLTFHVTVVQPSLMITGSNTVNVGSTAQLSALYTDASGPDQPVSAVWQSSDPAIATIDTQTGVATGMKIGPVTITATYQTGSISITATFVLTVEAPVIPPQVPGWRSDWRYEDLNQTLN